MNKQRKDELRAKGAIVAWTCQDAYGLCHLFYLKAQNRRFSVMREAEKRDVRIAPRSGYYLLYEKYRLPLLIMSIRSQLRMRSVSVSKPIYLANIEKVKVIPRLRRRALKERK